VVLLLLGNLAVTSKVLFVLFTRLLMHHSGFALSMFPPRFNAQP
jgi:hypothetical protein